MSGGQLSKPDGHGTRTCYVWGSAGRGPGCRCDGCTEANRVYEAHRERQIVYGRWQPFTDAEPVREHLRTLSEARIGRRRVMQLTGISSGALTKLLYGQRGRPPSPRVRTETAEAILAIRPEEASHSAQYVDGAGARHRLQALVAARYSRTSLTRELGISHWTIDAILEGKQVTPRTDQAVREGYSRVWDKPPPERTRGERRAASIAANQAQRMGWAPPAAWEDLELDRPDGKPVAGWQPSSRVRHRSADLAEDADFIIRTEGCGLTRAAERLGVPRDTLEHAMLRTARREAAELAAEAVAEPAEVLQLPVTREPEPGDEELALAEMEAG